MAQTKSGSGAGVAILVTTIGGLMVYSALKGISITDVLAGREGDKLDPHGASIPSPVISTIEPGVTGTSGATSSPRPSGQASYDRALQEMNRITACGSRYLYGGGHAGYDDGPCGRKDCSGAISRVLHVAGMLPGPPQVSGWFATNWGEPGKGRLFTIYANVTHVFLRDERTQRDWGTNSGNSGSWHHHSTLGFVARHYPGM